MQHPDFAGLIQCLMPCGKWLRRSWRDLHKKVHLSLHVEHAVWAGCDKKSVRVCWGRHTRPSPPAQTKEHQGTGNPRKCKVLRVGITATRGDTPDSPPPVHHLSRGGPTTFPGEGPPDLPPPGKHTRISFPGEGTPDPS